jgi:uncharacterized protein YjaG (DUF416 family)
MLLCYCSIEQRCLVVSLVLGHKRSLRLIDHSGLAGCVPSTATCKATTQRLRATLAQHEADKSKKYSGETCIRTIRMMLQVTTNQYRCTQALNKRNRRATRAYEIDCSSTKSHRSVVQKLA